MNSVIKATIKRPVTVCVLVIILLAVGVLATLDMSTNLLPNMSMPYLGVSVVYPGAGAQSVEDDVTSVLENALQTVPGITELETISYDNVSVAILTFDYGTDVDGKADEIEEILKGVTFPSGCYDPAFVKIDMNGTATATIAVFDQANNAEILTANANALATKLRAIEGVGSVEVLGTSTNQVKITALQGLDITSLLLVQALSTENLNIPLGTIMQDGTTVSIRNASDAASLLDIMQIPATLELGSGTLSSITSLKAAIKVFAICTLDEFEDYVQKSLDARSVIEEIEGKTADELEEQQNSLASIKSLMPLVRENSSQSLKLMWHTIDTNLVQNEEFVNMSDDDLQSLSDSTNMSVDLLKWLRDECVVPEGETEPPLKADWNKIVNFRLCMEHAELQDDISYGHFANLFQNGGSVTYATIYNPDGSVAATATEYYDGLDLLHSDVDHADCETEGADVCDREVFTHEEATDVCEFADSVNTVAYNDIINTVRDAEEKQANGETVEQPIISDEQFAALFINSTQSDDFSALMSPQVIHVIRQDNFCEGENNIVDVLTVSKRAHVNADGIAVYKNGLELTRNDDDEIVVVICGEEFKIDNFGRIVNSDNKLVNPADGSVLTLTDKQIEQNYYKYGYGHLAGLEDFGAYLIYTDEELLELYDKLETDTDFGINPTADTARLLRICNFSEDVDKLIVPVAYIGHVSAYEDKQSYAEYNGLLAATVKVYAVADANTTKVVQQVKKTLAGLDDENVLLLDDKAQFINDSITNVLSSIIIGGVLAVLVIYLFVRKIGSSLVVSITMPLSVLVALLGLWAMNISLNMVSLGGLAVGIGMLVDNSIVVLESITKHRDQGENVFDSCLNGTREVAGSLLASTLTNVCVFFPILFAQGLTREIFYDLVWAVIFSIVMSLLVAVTVIPSLYHLIYKNNFRPRFAKAQGETLNGSFEDMEPRASVAAADTVVSEQQQDGAASRQTADDSTADDTKSDEADGKSRRDKRRERLKEAKRKLANPNETIHKMEGWYGKVLSKVLTQRVLVCVVAFVVFGASIGLVFTTGTAFMPGVDKGLIEVNMSFDSSATLDDSKEAASIAAKLISDKYGDGLEYVSLTTGKQGMLATSVTNVLRVQLKTDKLNTSLTAQEIRQLLQEANLNVKNMTVTEVDGVVAEVTGGMAGQSVTLLSDDMELLSVVAEKVAERLASVDGIVSVTDNTAKKTEQISFTFDKEECAKRGVDYQNAVLMLRVGMSGHTATNVTIDGENMDVTVQFDEKTQNSLDELINVVVGFDNDGAVVLGDVLKKTEDGTPYTTDSVVSLIDKQDGRFVTTIDVESYGVDSGTVSSRIAKAVKEVLADYPAVTYEEGGVASYLTDAFNGLVISLIAAFLLLYGVMACQFESLIKPFIVIMSIPFSFTGGFLALAITGTTLNVVSFVGLIMLMGVIVNGAIIMIDKINLLIKEGVDPRQAVVDGCKSRLRPILMTTLTTVLALVPLALGLGRGGTLMQPMGIVVIGGLLLGTLVTLVLIPCFYCIIKRISFKQKPTTAELAEVSPADVTDAAAESGTVTAEAENNPNPEETSTTQQ